MRTKICNKCEVRRSLDRFPSNKQGHIMHTCKDCKNEAGRTKPRKHRAKVKQVEYVAKKPDGVLLPPYITPLAERPVYVPPKWEPVR